MDSIPSRLAKSSKKNNEKENYFFWTLSVLENKQPQKN